MVTLFRTCDTFNIENDEKRNKFLKKMFTCCFEKWSILRLRYGWHENKVTYERNKETVRQLLLENYIV